MQREEEFTLAVCSEPHTELGLDTCKARNDWRKEISYIPAYTSFSRTVVVDPKEFQKEQSSSIKGVRTNNRAIGIFRQAFLIYLPISYSPRISPP